MGVIGLAIGFYQLCIFGRCNRTEESMKARCPLRMNEVLVVLGTPYHVKVYAKIFSCHALCNWIMDEYAKKIFALSAAPLALIANKNPLPTLRSGLFTAGPSGLMHECLRKRRIPVGLFTRMY